MKNMFISCLLAFTFSMNVNGQGGNIVLHVARASARQTPKIVLGIGKELMGGIQEGITLTHKPTIMSMDSNGIITNEILQNSKREERIALTPELKLYFERKSQEHKADLNEKNQNQHTATGFFYSDRFLFGKQLTADDLMPSHFK